MKKISISAVITPSDDAVTVQDLKRCLSHLGSVTFIFASEVETVDLEEMDLPNEVWVYVSGDDSEPYVKVSGPRQVDGEEIRDKELEFMRDKGVCIEFHAEYPSANRYGAPLHATDEDFAAGIVGEHGFKVPAEGLQVRSEDRGDDGGEEIWLKIALPA